MERKIFIKLEDDFYQKEKDYREYRDQFFHVMWEGEKFKVPKVLTSKDIDEIKRRKALVDEAEKKLLNY